VLKAASDNVRNGGPFLSARLCCLAHQTAPLSRIMTTGCGVQDAV